MKKTIKRKKAYKRRTGKVRSHKQRYKRKVIKRKAKLFGSGKTRIMPPIYSVPSEVMGDKYGYADYSTGAGFVRNDLPKKMKKFVTEHERQHLLDPGAGRSRIRDELRANVRAGIKHPIGFAQTAHKTMSDPKRRRFYKDMIKQEIKR